MLIQNGFFPILIFLFLFVFFNIAVAIFDHYRMKKIRRRYY